MKIGAKLSVFNWNLRSRRKELGLTQAQLAELADIPAQHLSLMEILKHVPGDWSKKLEAVCDALDADFDKLFPKDYIDALTKKGLRNGVAPPVITREIELSKLIEMRHNDGLLTSTIEDDAQKSLTAGAINEELERLLSELTPREQRVIETRYGLRGGLPHTLRETGAIFDLSGERIRSIESEAFRKIKHPDKSERLNDLRMNGY